MMNSVRAKELILS